MTKSGRPYKVDTRRAARSYQLGVHPESGERDTGKVAEFLEQKYGVMGHFYDMHGQEIANDLASNYKKRLERILTGAPLEAIAANTFIDPIAVAFNKFIDNQEMDGVVPGVPTRASLQGKSARFKRGSSGKPRVSFRNTGNYENTMRAWLDDANSR